MLFLFVDAIVIVVIVVVVGCALCGSLLLVVCFTVCCWCGRDVDFVALLLFFFDHR